MKDRELASEAQKILAEMLVNIQRCQTSIAIIGLNEEDNNMIKTLQESNKNLKIILSKMKERI